jgi:GNAT superfamily N-acetyltransferase
MTWQRDFTSVRIRRARPQEGEQLRAIAIASKGNWGYDVDRVRRWAAGGDFSPEGLRGKDVFVAEVSGRAIAWAALIPKGQLCWLDDLWVEPEWIGRGIGTRLFEHAAERARQLGAVAMEWEAEPNALGFYERMGGRHVRDSEPNEWGRVLKVMAVDLASSPSPPLERS